MTTIAFRRYEDRVELACDSTATMDGRQFDCKKYQLLNGESLAMVCGSLYDVDRVGAWATQDFKTGEGDFTECDSSFIVAKAGKVLMGGGTIKQLIENPLEYHADGSGGDLAIGIMACGKSPGEAIAMIRDQRLDCFTGGLIHQFVMSNDGVIEKVATV